MSSPDELERMVAAGLVTAGQADGARRVDDDIAPTALGKLVCIGLDARTLLPGYAQAFGLTAASDEALARNTRPPLPQPMVDALAALAAAPTWGADGTIEIVVTAASTVSELAALGLPAHRVLVSDEPRVMALLDRVLAGEPTQGPPAPAAPTAARGRDASGPSQKAERFLARPVREIDRRPGGLNDPSKDSIVVAPFGASGPVDAPFPSGAVAAPFPSSASSPSAASSSASLELGAAPPKRVSSGNSGPSPVAARQDPREVSQPREAPLPEKPQKRGAPVAAIAVVVVVGGALAVGGVMMMNREKGERVGSAATTVADKRTAALDEARGKERAGEFAWAIAGYSSAADDPRRDDDTAAALLGRARCNVALGDREAALRDIDQVTSGAFASPPMKQKADALRASLQ